MIKASFLLLAFLVFGAVLISGCTQTSPPIPEPPVTSQIGNNLKIYDAVDNSINDFLSKENHDIVQPQNQNLKIYDAVDSSMNNFLSQNNLEIYDAVDKSVEQLLNNNAR